MNIILFEPDELPRLSRKDPRAIHILEVLRSEPGDVIQAGWLNGAAGRITLRAIETDALLLDFEPGAALPGLDAITLIVGLPRPQTAKKVLEQATSLGVQRIHFVRSDLGERSYAHSPLWQAGEYRRHLILGAQQAVTTFIPEITVALKLEEAIEAEAGSISKIALDNEGRALSLSSAIIALPCVVAIGSERGWSDRERDVLRSAGYTFSHLGPRVLRVETAAVAALSLVRGLTGLM